ncbi:MAG TPA: RnfABCDGE type electron transport complex subunit B [Phycisphaerae bacterium]|nr:RnfABCDGE type electron transport complex subunit B [Phycisphaerae bacterium]
MTLLIIILAAATMLVLAVFMAYVLGWANETFHVEIDPRVEHVGEVLPGANCGGCGFVGCGEYAEAVVAGKAPPDRCPVGGAPCAKAIAEILGLEVGDQLPYRPAVHCSATYEDRLKRNEYREGERTCAAANFVAGIQGCTYGCLGLGDCERACKYDAIHMIDGLATVDYEKCIGCGACDRACPRHMISMVPFKAEQMLVVACNNKDFGKDVKAVCKVGCIGCGACARFSELFVVIDNLARIDYDKYDPDKPDEVAKAVQKCPASRIVTVGTPSERDLAAVADKDMPGYVEGTPETTIDKTKWQG